MICRSRNWQIGEMLAFQMECVVKRLFLAALFLWSNWVIAEISFLFQWVVGDMQATVLLLSFLCCSCVGTGGSIVSVRLFSDIFTHFNIKTWGKGKKYKHREHDRV